jgi:hypothetical protein
MTRRNMLTLISPLAGAAAALRWPKTFTEAEVTGIALASRWKIVKWIYGESDRNKCGELREVRVTDECGSARFARCVSTDRFFLLAAGA